MKKILILIIFTLVSSILYIPHQTFACSCAMPESPQKELKEADYVFIGTVSSIILEDVLPGEIASMKSKNIIFNDTINIKGLKTNSFTISTSQNGGTCGINFQQDKEYIVYAYVGNDNEINTWSCSRTNQTEYAQDDLVAFKDIIEINKNSQLPVDYSQINYFAIIGSLITLLILLIYKLTQKDTD